MKKQYQIGLLFALLAAIQIVPANADTENSTIQIVTTTVVQNGSNNQATSNTEQGSLQRNSGEQVDSNNITTQISNAVILQIGNSNKSYVDVKQWIKQHNEH